MFKTVKKWIFAVVSMLMLGVQSVYAALPLSVGTTLTAIQADGQSVFDLVFPVVAAFLGLTVIIKLFKRFTNRV